MAIVPLRVEDITGRYLQIRYVVQIRSLMCWPTSVAFCTDTRTKIKAIISRDEDPDPLIFGTPDPDPLLFSLDPDPTCNDGFIRLYYLEQNVIQNEQIQA